MLLTVVGSLGTVSKELVQGLKDLEIRGWVESIQTAALLKSVRILSRVLETWRDSDCSRKTISLRWCEKPSNNNNNNNVSRKEGGRGLTSIEDSVDASIQRLEDYIQTRDRWPITAIRNDTENTMNNRMTKTRKQKWERKQLYGQFKRQINNISHEKSWTWQRKGNFKGETESLLIAAQNNAVRTNHIKARIDKTQQKSKCRRCGDRNETINHIISECSKLALREYEARHDWVGKRDSMGNV